jgi:CDGSH-type Zn-finger protein
MGEQRRNGRSIVTDPRFKHLHRGGRVSSGEAVDRPTISCRQNGSLRVDGVEILRDARGNSIRTEGRGKGNFALCRCGCSPIKPFCDGTHKTTGFHSARSAGREWGPAASTGGAGDGVEAAPAIEVTAHGPYIVTGGIELVDPEHGGRTAAARYVLCRCGRSADKPFCDGSHRMVGFADPGLDTTDPPGS